MEQEQVGIPFGKYDIFRKLAVGGMAEVFLAKQTGLGGFERTVVLKCILPHLAREQQFITMFLDEARLASLLNHPNIIQIYEIGEVEGIYYIAMEYVRGPTLKVFRKRLYQRNPRPHYGLISSIVAQAAAGLHYAHNVQDEQGKPLRVVHRDVSPTNLLLSYSGALKIVDFGVAKATIQEHKTRAGMVKGKYRYMSPEQILAEPIDHRSDLYSLGAILYELATNVVVFARRTEAETIRAVYQDPIMPPSKMIEDFPPALDQIIMKALARKVDERYQSANEMRRDLEAFLHERGQVFGPQEISEVMQTLFVEEQEAERSGLSGSALSKVDRARFSSGGFAPRIDESTRNVHISAASSPSLSQLPPEDRTTPSYEPPFSSFQDNLSMELDASLLPQSSPSTPSVSSHQEGMRWLIGALLLAVLIVGGFLLWLQEPDVTGQPFGKAESFEVRCSRIEQLLDDGKSFEAQRALMALQTAAKTPKQRERLRELQSYLHCLPKLDVARELHRQGEYRSALRLLDALVQRCPKVLMVRILKTRVRQALKNISQHHPPDLRALESRRPATTPPRPMRRRRKRRWRHRGRRRRGQRRNRRKMRRARRQLPRMRPRQTPPTQAFGQLFVNAPLSARVYVDGRLIGFAPVNGKKVPVGTHKIRVVLEGFVEVSRGIQLRPDKPTILSIKMVRRAKPRTKMVRRAKPRTVAPRSIIHRRQPLPRRRAARKQPRLPFRAIRLPRRYAVRLFLSDPRGILARRYTDQHRVLCQRIEREVQRVLGPAFSVAGVTTPWLRYVRRRYARSGKDQALFYPRAVAFVIYSYLKRGRSKRRVAQLLVSYERRHRWRRVHP